METTKEVDTTRVYQKGPEFLRKQMELESENKMGMSAVERLAASKLKYVKSQQVVNSTQQPVINIGSASVSSNGSSNRSRGSKKSGTLITGRNPNVATGDGTAQSPEQENVVRRSSSKKRPDSLLLYRQKCELLKSSTTDSNKRNKAHRLLLKPASKNGPLLEATDKPKECTSELATPGGITNGILSNAVSGQAGKLLTQITQQGYATDEAATNCVLNKPSHKRVTEVQKRSGRGIGRSHSDISSRYSKNFADFDAFFLYCGLDAEIIESLGKDHFLARSDDLALRSVSVSTSDDGFSRNSGDSDGLLEEELCNNIRQGTSIIERNARIIKWLYSCKNAKENGKKLRELD